MQIKLLRYSDEQKSWKVSFYEREYQAVDLWFRQLRARDKWYECGYGDWKSKNLYGLIGHHQQRWRQRRESSAHSDWQRNSRLEVVIVVKS